MRAHPLIAALDPPKRLDSTYFDTPDLALRAAGFSLRLRTDGVRRMQTIKTLDGGAGLWDRGEWERAVSGETPDLAAAQATPLADLLDRDGVAGRLGPRFTVSVERTSGLVREKGVEVELSLDVGEAAAGDNRAPVVELELELRRGGPSDLFALAERLLVGAPLRLSSRSKAETGYDLIAPPEAVKADTVDLDRSLSSAEALRRIARACLAHFLRNERLVRERRSVESVHQARVAVRRLRAAMTLFQDLVQDPQSLTLKQGLRDLAGALGAARDLDVLIARLETVETEAPVDRDGLKRVLERRRERAYDAAVQALSTPETGRLCFDISAWLETGAWLTSTDALQAARRDQPVARFAADELSRRARKLRKAALAIEDLAPADRHEVRKHAKKVRYGAEFFHALARRKDRKAARAFIEALKPLQETLGELNDIVAAQEQLQILATEDKGAAVYAAGAVVEALSRDSQDRLQAAADAAKTFAKAAAFL